MIVDEPPGVSPIVAVMLVCALLCMLALGLIMASLVSRSFQRAQDERFKRPPSRTEWLRVNLAIWVRDVIDGIRRAF